MTDAYKEKAREIVDRSDDGAECVQLIATALQEAADEALERAAEVMMCGCFMPETYIGQCAYPSDCSMDDVDAIRALKSKESGDD